jgi:hypothetical protein
MFSTETDLRRRVARTFRLPTVRNKVIRRKNGGNIILERMEMK